MIVVAHYSVDTPYEREAKVFRASLERAGMAHHIEPFDSRGTWDANTARKPVFLRRVRRTLVGPLLYLDVDAFVHENCEAYFDGLAARGIDFGAHWFCGPAFGFDRTKVKPHGWWMLTGTLFLGDTPGCRNLLRAWCQENDRKRRRGDASGGGQANLQGIIPKWEHRLSVERIPGRYCYVFDKPWAYPEDEPCIIEHTIASRENRGHNVGRRNVARQARIKQLKKLLEVAA